MRVSLYPTFVDLTKAFDKVNREGLWKIMQKFGCPQQFTQMLRQHHGDMTAYVTDNEVVPETFTVTNGVKQSCVLAPSLFGVMFSAMLMGAHGDESPGIRIAYRTDAHHLISGGCTSSCVYPQRPSMNFSASTTAHSTPPRKTTCKGRL
ncbi:hypothetical protein SprV_0100304100 [Sparganum proliferum]